MNITAGKYKGKKVKTPKSNVRPTSSRIRESIFNIINVEGLRVLDVFAGSGIMSLESLSREAKEVVCLEKNAEVLKILKENLGIAQDEIKLLIGDALKLLDRLIGEEFDFIFIDPPYDSGLYGPVLSKIKENKLLSREGFVVLEHACRVNIFVEDSFEVYKAKKYGDTCVTILISTCYR